MSVELQLARAGATAQTITVGNHVFVGDMPEIEGGADEGPSPHDLYDAAIGSCKALTVLWYAKKKGIPVTDVRTSVVHDNSEERHGIYRLQTTLHIGGNFSDQQLDELASVAEKCPVHKLMTIVKTEIDTVVKRIE